MTSSPSKIIGALLTGRATLFGARVELRWPDGPPPGWSEADLRELGERWWAPADPRWTSDRGNHPVVLLPQRKHAAGVGPRVP